MSAINALQKTKINGEILTGLIYIEPESKDLHHLLNTVDTPLNKLGAKELCPGNEALQELNAELR
jgi:2-oxoglutarate/2-oxoacid ferredoxin oxidoreductase subunit beta